MSLGVCSCAVTFRLISILRWFVGCTGEAARTNNNEEVDSTALASGEVSRLLQQSEDPRVRNSQLLQFMRGLNVGALKIEGNTVVQKKEIPTHVAETSNAYDMNTPYGSLATSTAQRRAQEIAVGQPRSFPGEADSSRVVRSVHADPGPTLKGDVDVGKGATMERAWEDHSTTTSTKVSSSRPTFSQAPSMPIWTGPVYQMPSQQQQPAPQQEQEQGQGQGQERKLTEQEQWEKAIGPSERSVQPANPAVARATELYDAGHLAAAVGFCRSVFCFGLGWSVSVGFELRMRKSMSWEICMDADFDERSPNL